jgi:hypothetical protein
MLALITRFVEIEGLGGTRLHSEVECGYRVVEGEAGRVVQFDTYGPSDRQIPGKVSQSIQIRREQAEELMAILRHAFPGLG